MPESLHSNIYAELAEFGRWDSVSGGGLTQNMTGYTPGGERVERKLEGTNKFEDITLMRAWDPARDQAVVDWCKRVMLAGLREPKNLTKFTLSPQGAVLSALSYSVKPIGCKPPDGKSGDDSVADFTVTLAVEKEI